MNIPQSNALRFACLDALTNDVSNLFLEIFLALDPFLSFSDGCPWNTLPKISRIDYRHHKSLLLGCLLDEGRTNDVSF